MKLKAAAAEAAAVIFFSLYVMQLQLLSMLPNSPQFQSEYFRLISVFSCSLINATFSVVLVDVK